MHKAVREGFVNLIIHSDYMMDAGVLKVIKKEDGFEFTNPGVLKLPKEEIYLGGNSKARNPKMQTMLRMVGFGDNAGSGFPAILKAWSNNGWVTPELVENTVLNQVCLSLTFEKAAIKNGDKKTAKKSEVHIKNIIEFLSTVGEASTAEIAEKIGLKPSRTREILSTLDDVEAIGSNKDRKYILKSK